MKKAVLAIALSSFIAAPAFAADKSGKYYVAGDFAFATYSNANITINNVVNTFPNPNALVIAGGYNFTPMLAAEIGYSMFGSSTLTSASGDVTLATSSLTAVAVGTYPVNQQFDLFGKLGLANNSWTESTTGTLAFAGGATSQSGSQSSILYGFGAAYHYSDKTDFRAQYVNYGNFSSGSNPLSATTLGVGITYTF